MSNLVERFITVCIVAPLVLLALLYQKSVHFLCVLAMAINWLEFLDMSYKQTNKVAQIAEVLIIGVFPFLSVVWNWPLNKILIMYLLLAVCSAKSTEKSMAIIMWRSLGLLSFIAPLHLCMLIHGEAVSSFHFHRSLGRSLCSYSHHRLSVGYRYLRTCVRKIIGPF